jgi:hypothetical protein
MKRVYFVIVCFIFSSCASVFNPGPATPYQKKRPGRGQPKRELRMPYFVLDVIFGGIPLLVDLGTKKIYKPNPKVTKRKKIMF